MLVDNIRNKFIELNNTVPEGEMLEIIGASFEADEPSIFGTVNQEYVDAEIKWYGSEVCNTKKLKQYYGKTPEAWKHTSNSNGTVNSNYGFLIFSNKNGSQFDNVLYELRSNPDSRRAVMIYQRPSMHRDYCSEGMNDFVCTNAVHYYIRDGQIDAVVQMRSNDCVFGYKNDYAWQRHVLKQLSVALGIPDGKIHWCVANLHIYPKHRHLVG